MLSSGSPAEVEEALDDAAEMYAGDFSLDENQASLAACQFCL